MAWTQGQRLASLREYAGERFLMVPTTDAKFYKFVAEHINFISDETVRKIAYDYYMGNASGYNVHQRQLLLQARIVLTSFIKKEMEWKKLKSN